MNRIAVRSVGFDLTYYSIAAERLTTMACRACRAELDLHQPSPGQPDQFLATCPECNAWYRIESVVDREQATVVQLPEVAEVARSGPSDQAAG